MSHAPRSSIFLVTLSTCLLCVPLSFAAPQGADRDPSPAQLKQLLERFPAADANNDGTLTADEARTFRSQQRRNAASQTQRDNSRIQPTHADVAYGKHERQVLDFYQANSDEPTPLVIYIHGGGFVGGNKGSIHQGMLRSALDSGISMAALHYRFVDGQQVIFPAPQQDCARALQFIRSKAVAWNIDAQRIACFGGSAGAGISMWIGFHEDLVNPQSADPIARESTRIVAIGTMGGQGTYDPIEIKELVGGRAWEHPSIFKVYGIRSVEEALNPSPEKQALYDEASAITHLTKDDPPLFMTYSEPDIVPPADARPGQFIHHPNFGKQLKKRMDALGIPNTYVHTAQAQGRNLPLEMLDFFKQQFSSIER